MNNERKWNKLKKKKPFTLDKLQMEIEGEKNEFDRLVGS